MCRSETYKTRISESFSIVTSNDQRLRSAGDNNRRSTRFCSRAVLCVSFTWQMVKNAPDQISSDRRSKHAWSNCVLCTPHILSGSPNECNECWLHTCDVWVIKTCRLGLRAPGKMTQLRSRYKNATPNLCWKMCVTHGACINETGLLSSAAVVPQSKSTELRSSAAVVPQSKSTELCGSAAIVSHKVIYRVVK